MTKMDELKTYNEIADKHKLEEPQRTRFIAYMRFRWGDPKDEDIKCRVGYASEWAERFKERIEVGSSDSYGRKILSSIDPAYYGKSWL